MFLPLALVHKALIAIIFAAYLMLSAIRAELVEAWACALDLPHAWLEGGGRGVRPAAQ